MTDLSPALRRGRAESGEQAQEAAVDARRSPARTPQQVSVAAVTATPTAIPQPPVFVVNATVPRSVLKAMASAGAAVRYIDGLRCLYCTMGDAAHERLRSWAEEVDDDKDPGLMVVVCPMPPAVPVLPVAAQGLVLQEANAILHHYRSLRAADFHQGSGSVVHPAIPGNIGPVPLPARFVNPTIATMAVLERIANPAVGGVVGGAPYAGILAVPAGTYLCTAMQLWKGSLLSVHVLRT